MQYCTDILFILYTFLNDPLPATFIDISAVHANSCMKFRTTVKQENSDFIVTVARKLVIKKVHINNNTTKEYKTKI